MPQPLPFPSSTLRSVSPKPDPSELYLKSKAMLDSKRESTPRVLTSIAFPVIAPAKQNCHTASSPPPPPSPYPSPAPNTKDLDVFIKRNQESGFGFRVLGGEGPDQPVSMET